MNFKINKLKWKIKLVDQDFLKKMNNDIDKDSYYFGQTRYTDNTIYICEDVLPEIQIRTLRHELMHCYLWSYGLRCVPVYNEEMVCDLAANASEFINEIVEKFTNSQKGD